MGLLHGVIALSVCTYVNPSVASVACRTNENSLPRLREKEKQQPTTTQFERKTKNKQKRKSKRRNKEKRDQDGDTKNPWSLMNYENVYAPGKNVSIFKFFGLFDNKRHRVFELKACFFNDDRLEISLGSDLRSHRPPQEKLAHWCWGNIGFSVLNGLYIRTWCQVLFIEFCFETAGTRAAVD